MVRKVKGGWQICQDYIDLNKACSKDSFPLPRIDQLINATTGHDLLSFMDAYSSLKNARATYQRLVNRIFAKHIGSTMEVYVDDMLVKSRTTGEHLHNLSLMFSILKDYQMRIEANLEKIKAIIDMERPMTQKNIQSLTGRVAALTRFIFKATDNTAVSSVLIHKLEKAELPIFYISKALQSAELRLIKWAIKLGEFDVQFKPRPAEKCQVVVDFLSKLTPSVTPEPTHPSTDAEEHGVPSPKYFNPSISIWILNVDGSANQQGCGAGLVLTMLDRVKIEYALCFSFRTSNNEAEYEALLVGLFAYLSATHQLLQKFWAYEIRQIPRTENSHADTLARLAFIINDKIGSKVPAEILDHPSIVTSEVCTVWYGICGCLQFTLT
ncbi:unnamed protein product [Prunus armeniaca]